MWIRAVKDSWNDNGYYTEYEVPPGKTLKIWEGKTAGQRYEVHDGKNFYLEGVDTQLFLDRGAIKNFELKLTNWRDAI